MQASAEPGVNKSDDLAPDEACSAPLSTVDRRAFPEPVVRVRDLSVTLRRNSS
jgi:hypothetical protein